MIIMMATGTGKDPLLIITDPSYSVPYQNNAVSDSIKWRNPEKLNYIGCFWARKTDLQPSQKQCTGIGAGQFFCGSGSILLKKFSDPAPAPAFFPHYI
jgi:hypothetical protein